MPSTLALQPVETATKIKITRITRQIGHQLGFLEGIVASMLACLDVDYRDESGPAVAACVLFENWLASSPSTEVVTTITSVASYEPGNFYRRELPCLMAVLANVSEVLDVIVVDGHVWLDAQSTPGLGAHLYDALNPKVPIVGVAKRAFKDGLGQIPVLRGESAAPLYVSSVGIEAAVAATAITAMAGEFRIPDLLKRVDRLCRDTLV